MISVASLENSKRLFEVSDWKDTEFVLLKYSLAKEPLRIERPPEGIGFMTLPGKLEWKLPYYDLSFLLDKLPPILPGGKTTLRLFTLPIVGGAASDKKAKWVIGYDRSKHENIADTAVDAACLLCIKLFETNVMKKGVN